MPKTKQLLIVGGVALAGLMLLLIAACCWSMAMTPTPAVVPTASLGVLEPTATPYWLTISGIEDKLQDMTDLQQDQYLPTLQGQIVRFSGKVRDVESDGAVTVSVGERFFTLVQLEGVSVEDAMNLAKGQYIQGEGTLSIDTHLLRVYTIHVTSLQ